MFAVTDVELAELRYATCCHDFIAVTIVAGVGVVLT